MKVEINMELLDRVWGNDNNCLCKLDTYCPCSELKYLNEGEMCTCGVFTRLQDGGEV